MTSLFNFIIRPQGENQYNTEKELGDGKSLILTGSIENAKDVNRIGIVSQLPVGYSGDIQVGDEVVIHHNVFRDYYDSHGKLKHSSHYLFDNYFLVSDSDIYLYRSKSQDSWITNLDYCFVKPIYRESFSVLKEVPLVGTLVYTKWKDKEFNTVGFTPESEYEIKLENNKGELELLYRMRHVDICLDYERVK